MEFPQHVAASWLGYSVAVSLRQYVQTPDHLLDLAAAGKSLRAAKSAAENCGTGGNGVENGSNPEPDDQSSDDEETRVYSGNSDENAGLCEVVRGGVEPPTHGFSVHCSTN